MPTINISVVTRGRLWTTDVPAWTRNFVEEAKTAVAQEGVDLVHIMLDRVLQNPTGFYRSQVQVERVRNDLVLTDGGVIYGGWLEGVSERNKATRFKGYFTFRTVTRDLRKVAGVIAQRSLSRLIGQLN
jgi:hypothetical protein